MAEDTRQIGQFYLASDLRVGDTVGLGPRANEPWDSHTVTQATDEFIVLLRPYLHTSDFTYSGNQLIAYTGLSETRIDRVASLKFQLQRKSEVGKAWEASQRERNELLAEIERLRALAVTRNETIARYDQKLVDTELKLKAANDRNQKLRDDVAELLDKTLEAK